MPESKPQSPEKKKINLSKKVAVIFVVFTFIGATGVYFFMVSVSRQQVNRLIQNDLQQVLQAISASVDAEMLLDLAENGEPNAAGFSDDPRYVSLMDTLDAFHQIEPDAWPYLYIPGDSDNQIYFVVDLMARYEPKRSASFMEAYQSNSGYILIGLDQQTFREVDAQFIQLIRKWGSRTDWMWLKNSLHGLANGLVDLGIFPKKDFGIYDDKFGRWASGYRPIENTSGERVAAVGVDFKAELIEAEYLKMRRLIFFVMLGSTIGPIFLVVSFLRRLVFPLDELTTIALNIQHDIPATEKSFRNFGEARTIDEIESLAEVLEGMIEQIRQRERRYHAVIDAQDAIILRASPDGQFTFSNQAYGDLRGKQGVNSLSRVTGDGVHPEDQQEALNFLREELPTITFEDPVRKHEMRIYDQDGNLKWYLWSITGIFNDRGELTEFQGVGQDITELKDIQYKLEKANNRLREISHELFNATEQERNKIARDVHDDMLNYISELVLNLDGDIPAEMVNQTYLMIADRLRETVYNLRPPMLAYGLNFGLKDYVHNLTERLEGIAAVHFDLTESEAKYPKEVDIHLFRIVQQACENVVEHAGPDNLTISGDLLLDAVHLIVEDDGIGFGWNNEGFIDESVGENRFGLAGMLERGLIVGAKVDITSEKGSGTRIEITWRAEDYQQIRK